ncbi:MAG TPA: hypothetical protein VMA75_02725 [Candidatus Paceibacterota bacterium]|nr:hypothetical protein [Candidatus Paceibacterota bacterium]
MMRKEDLDLMVGAAVRAPSGENCQPWRFVFKNETLFIYNLPDRDRSPYNFNQFGSFVSHGAAIENVIIAASVLGYRVDVTLFPLPAETDCTAALKFAQDASIKKDGLYESISLRASNRTAYAAGHILEEEEKSGIAGSAAETAIPARLIFVSDAEKKRMIAGALSYGDRLLFENRAVHDFLFKHIYWTLNDALNTKSGFYVKELALKPPQEFTFKLLKKESMRRFFATIGLSAMAAKENAALYEHSSALGAVVTKGNSPRDFIEGGRLMERTWLAATARGYDIQLLTAISFFHQRIAGNEAADFSVNQVHGIEQAYGTLSKEFGTDGETIIVMFRIGKGGALPHRSLRLDPIFEYHS